MSQTFAQLINGKSATVEFSTGSASTPSVAFSGDTNTGIFSPGADQLAISTGGSGRLFVDSSGRTLVGTSTAPTAGTWNQLARIVNLGTTNNSAGAGVLSLNRGTAASSIVAGNPLGVLSFGDSSGNEFGLITCEADATAGTNDYPGRLVFSTTADGASSPTERLRITSAGLVGIGTSSPSQLLHIYQPLTNSQAYQIIENNRSRNAATQYKTTLGAWYTGVGIGADVNRFTIYEDGVGDRLVIDSSGRVGIGSTAPNYELQINASDALSAIQLTNTSTGTTASDGFIVYNNGVNATISNEESGYLRFQTAGTERAQIDSSGRLLVGTSTSNSSFDSRIQIAGNGLGGTQLISRFDANNGGPVLWLAKSRSSTVGTNTIVQSGDSLGSVGFYGADGTNYIPGAGIDAYVDGTPGTNDMPGRLVFSTTADGASSPTERARINQLGFSKFSNNGSYRNANDNYHEFYSTSNDPALFVTVTNGSFSKDATIINAHRAASSSYSFLLTRSGNDADIEHYLRGDGQAYADGSWNGGGADYAEYFEWSDSNPDEEDRRGISVVLDGDKIREAIAGEDPIGVISGNPSVVGDAAWNKWSGKYLRDEFGSYLLDENGERQLNSAYDPDVEYIPREQRPEWDCVGLVGKLRIRKGQVTGSRWIKMRDISDSVEEWLVR